MRTCYICFPPKILLRNESNKTRIPCFTVDSIRYWKELRHSGNRRHDNGQQGSLCQFMENKWKYFWNHCYLEKLVVIRLLMSIANFFIGQRDRNFVRKNDLKRKRGIFGNVETIVFIIRWHFGRINALPSKGQVQTE